jgi:hypothetical protein
MAEEQATALGWIENLLRSVPDVAREGTYLTVGFGLLAFQRIQVHRRELERALARRCATAPTTPAGEASSQS